MTVVIGILGDELIVGDVPMAKATATMGELMRRFRSLGIERITISRPVTPDELKDFAGKFGQIEKTLSGNALKDAAAQLDSENIHVGRVSVEETVPQEPTDALTIRKMYSEAVSVASLVWESARSDSAPEPSAAQSMIDGLAQAVVQNRSALMALTALKEYDNYTFTHMVNVSILTMAQARGLGIDGPMLREFGMAALMHDIGKVKTPPEILNKPDKLTDEEFTIMKRHVVDGAEILRGTPRDTHPRTRCRLRASPAARRHRLSRPRVEAEPQPGDDAVRHCRCVRRHAIAAEVSAGVSIGTDCGRAAEK